MKNNTLVALTIFLNIIKDIAAVGICGALAWYFNNIWIILFALLFTGGYTINFRDGDEKDG